LSYIALRILGEGPEDGEDMAMERGRRWILDHGGLVGIPSWGKLWVTVNTFISSLYTHIYDIERCYIKRMISSRNYPERVIP
jgi:hypothetical protein